jgi:hypothetical protein
MQKIQGTLRRHFIGTYLITVPLSFVPLTKPDLLLDYLADTTHGKNHTLYPTGNPERHNHHMRDKCLALLPSGFLASLQMRNVDDA